MKSTTYMLACCSSSRRQAVWIPTNPGKSTAGSSMNWENRSTISMPPHFGRPMASNGKDRPSDTRPAANASTAVSGKRKVSSPPSRKGWPSICPMASLWSRSKADRESRSLHRSRAATRRVCFRGTNRRRRANHDQADATGPRTRQDLLSRRRADARLDDGCDPPARRHGKLSVHFTQCGSVKGEFSFLLPPGKFDFQVYSSSPNAQDAKTPRTSTQGCAHRHAAVSERHAVDVSTGQSTLDLGTLNVELPVGVSSVKGDYSRYYGKEPPALSITDARGVAKDLKLSDLRGKWVLLDFWTLWCGPCVHESLPRLA